MSILSQWCDYAFLSDFLIHSLLLDTYKLGNVHYQQCKVLSVACPLAVCEILTHMFCNSAQEQQ